VIEDSQVYLELKENLVNVAFQVMLKQPMDPLVELVQKVTEVKMAFQALKENQEKKVQLVNKETLEGQEKTERMVDVGLKEIQGNLVLQVLQANVEEKVQ